MMNRSTGKNPFWVNYTKESNHTVDVAILPKCHNTSVVSLAKEFKSIIEKTRTTLQQANDSYKALPKKHKCVKQFNPGDLVMVRIRKERYPKGQ